MARHRHDNFGRHILSFPGSHHDRIFCRFEPLELEHYRRYDCWYAFDFVATWKPTCCCMINLPGQKTHAYVPDMKQYILQHHHMSQNKYICICQEPLHFPLLLLQHALPTSHTCTVIDAGLLLSSFRMHDDQHAMPDQACTGMSTVRTATAHGPY